MKELVTATTIFNIWFDKLQMQFCDITVWNKKLIRYDISLTKSSISNIMVRWCDISQKRTMRTRFTIYFGKSMVVWIESLQKFTLRNNVKKKTMIE